VLWRQAEHEPLLERAWDENFARAAIASIVADAETAIDSDGFWPGHPLDDLAESERLCSLYLGSGGMVWGLWKLGSRLDAAALASQAIERYRREPDLGPEGHAPSLLLGESGLLALADAVGSPAADRERLRRLVHENREHPTWELLWGSPGTMLAARASGLDEEWRESARLLWASCDAATGVWTQDMYGQITQYLGAGHGFVANINSLRGHVSEEDLRARTTQVLQRTAGTENGLINWPPLDEPFAEAAEKIRVQWCHGAPGILCMVGDLIPRELALAAGELVWRAGPLRKGAGLCHGTAGNGYAFLKLHSLTGDPVWIERARRFAMHAVEQVTQMRAEHGRGRYTLWTGDLGVAVYLEACISASAAFPIIDGF